MAFAIYGGPQANRMAEVVLNLTKEAVSPKREAFRQFCKLQIFNIIQFVVKMSNAAGRLGTYTHTQTTIIIPCAHALSINN